MINEELERAIEYEDFKRDKLKDDIHDLYEENKQLKDLLHKANDEVISYTNCCIDLKERIDKAIEYNKNILKEKWYGGNEKKYAKNNLEILGDKE